MVAVTPDSAYWTNGMALERRDLLRLLLNFRPPFLRRFHNRRSTSGRWDALLHTNDFALQMSQRKVNPHWRKREGLLELDSGSG
jgi:hypothetical protein